mmetsp:Transcript_340/g.341  ORF Transcript_340/g.341 Transcript_340/m.341 type:complete len:86 (+) Transcript_340:78-335(+)
MPIFKASVVFHHMICGGVMLQEFFNFSLLQIMMFIVGMLICIAGIFVMLLPHLTPKNEIMSPETEDKEAVLFHHEESSDKDYSLQ